jgi:threonine 3-dehydrogenase
MKAIVKRYRKPGLWIEDVPIPEIKDREVLIKTRKMAICGTDIHIYKWDEWAQKTIPVPIVIGHEFMGEIVKVGRDVIGLKEGDRVCGEGHITCGRCPPCLTGKKHLCMRTIGVGVHRDGSFAEYIALPAENVFPLSSFVKDDIAAIFDPYGNATHAALSFELTGEDVLITGAGPIGIMSAAIARKAGARHVVITDLNDYRLELAGKMGATCIVNVSKTSLADVVKSLGIEYGFTVGLEMSGHPQGLSTLLEYAQHGGRIALLGILPPGSAIDWDLVIFKMLQIKGIYGREIFATWFKMTHLLEAGLNIDPLITHHFPFEEFEKGFEAMMSGMCGKVILSHG